MPVIVAAGSSMLIGPKVPARNAGPNRPRIDAAFNSWKEVESQIFAHDLLFDGIRLDVEDRAKKPDV
jgi:hypothetical protein